MVRRGPVLKRLRFYLSQMPPENVRPNKKLNATTRGVVEVGKALPEGMEAGLEEVQQRMLYSYLRSLLLRGKMR